MLGVTTNADFQAIDEYAAKTGDSQANICTWDDELAWIL